MAAFKKDQEVLYDNKLVTIIEVIKGKKTNTPIYQSNILQVGFKSTPCSYLLSNGKKVNGTTLKKENINFNIHKTIELFDNLTDTERCIVMDKCCKHCGSKDTNCQCWNDE